MDDSLERDATTATSLDAEQDRGNIFNTQSNATPNEPGSQGTSSGGGPRYVWFNDLDGDEVIVESVDVAEQAKEVVDDITLAKALIEIKVQNPRLLRPKAKGLVIHEQKQAPTPIVFSQQPSQVKDKDKGKMVKFEPVKKLSKKDQFMLDEELAFKLQAKEEEEEERIAREKSQQIKEVNID
nr:hypothetical protein [Tanacetum cinerariifolium]